MNTGFLLINKPSGPTSHDIIDELRKITGLKKIGHAGTLDPFASGLLIVGVGREATRQLGLFLKMDKTYKATIKLGVSSDTFDRTGKIKKITGYRPTTSYDIEQVLKSFEGKIEQIPPMFSAKKIKGKKLYELARKGQTVNRKPQDVTIYKIKLLATNNSQLVTINVHCSSGTYIRSLAQDIGQKLGTGAILETLVRTAIDRYTLKEAIELDQLNQGNWQKFLVSQSTPDCFFRPIHVDK